VFGVFSAGYGAVVPDRLAAEDWRDVPRFDPLIDTGNPRRVVPAKVGRSLLSLMRTGLQAPRDVA